MTRRGLFECVRAAFFQPIVLTKPNNIQPQGFTIQGSPTPASPLKDIGLDKSLTLLPPDQTAGYYRLAAIAPQVQFPPNAVLQNGFYYLTLPDGTNIVSLDMTYLKQVFVTR